MSDLLRLPDEPGSYLDIYSVIFEAEQVIEVLMKSGLEHSKAAARDVTGTLNTLFENALDPKGEIDLDKPLGKFAVSRMKQSVRDFQTILIRECPTLPVFFIPQKGLHRTADLIDRGELDFPEALRKSIPSQAIDEIRQGGKAFALDMFTAFAFHAMRAAEIVMLVLLRDYYNQTLKESDRNWGNYIRVIKDNGGDPELVRYLNEMARIERNEGIHPTKLLNEEEADMRYTVAKGAIMAMIRDLKNRSFYDEIAVSVAAKSGKALGAGTRALLGLSSVASAKP